MPSGARIPIVREEVERHTEEPPENWPEDVIYLTDHTYSDAVTPEQRLALSRPAPESDPWTRVPKDQIAKTLERVKIGMISDEKHPAFGQRALLARTVIEPDTFITLYLGHVHNNSMSDTDPDSDYDLSLDRDIGLSVDAYKSGNIARFANDYRGIAERPNAEFRDCFIKVPCDKRAHGTRWERRVGIWSLPAGRAGKRKPIQPGQELTVSYGKSYWEARRMLATFRRDADLLALANAALDE